MRLKINRNKNGFYMIETCGTCLGSLKSPFVPFGVLVDLIGRNNAEKVKETGKLILGVTLTLPPDDHPIEETDAEETEEVTDPTE